MNQAQITAAAVIERREAFDRMAGLVVSILCCVTTLCLGIVVWAAN